MKKLTASFYDGNKTNFMAAALSMLYNGIMFVLVAVVMQKILDIAAGKNAGQIKGAICMAAIYIIMLVSGWLVEWVLQVAENRRCLTCLPEVSGIIREAPHINRKN